MAKSPAVILYNATGIAMSVLNGVAIPVGTSALIIAGSDGTNSRFVRTAVDGTVRTDPTGTTTQPVSDGAGSLTTDTPQLPAALVDGRLDENIGAWFGSTVPTVGQKTMAASIPVTLASNQAAIPVTIGVTAGAVTGIVAGTILLGGATAGTLVAIRGTPYTEQSTNGQRSVSSSSALDTAAGTGARTIRIDYLATAGLLFSETLTLNGVTPVNTVATNICFIERITVLTVGSLGRNAGTVTLFVLAGGLGGTIGTIGIGGLVAAQGDNRTLWAHHYVPAAMTAKLATYIISAESGGSGTNGTFFLRTYPLPIGSNAEIIASDIILTTGPLVRQLAIPIQVIGPARIIAYAVPAVNNAKLNASFDFSELPT